jgi:hypothetical protein
MGVELLVYIYFAVCLAMIIFNIMTIVFAKRRDRLNKKQSDRYRAMICEQLARIRDGKDVEERHVRYVKHHLLHQENLLVFVQVMTDLSAEFTDEIKIYLDRISVALDDLIDRYKRNNDPIKFAFFLYTLRVFQQMSGVTPPKIAELLIGALLEPNTYCRENALQAIYRSGDTNLVIRALEVIDSERINHNKKLLSDGLLAFTGSKDELMNGLWEVFETFGPNMQVVILDYIRFCAPSHRDRLLSILADDKRSPELRFSCIRYFGKYPDENAYPLLLKMVEDPDSLRWEYPAIACTALASYPGEKTVEALKRALHVSNWYVRYNAADSLAKLGVSYVDLIEVIDGNDRFAREILQFQLDMKYNRQKEADAR